MVAPGYKEVKVRENPEVRKPEFCEKAGGLKISEYAVAVLAALGVGVPK